MSIVTHHAAGGSRTFSICWFRWGGGAHPGHYHVFDTLPWDRRAIVPMLSEQCVVDDFGDLVRTGSPA